MSYILDALRRAEADRERERGQVPGLHTQPLNDPAAAPAPGPRRWLPWAGGGLLLLAGIGAGSWLTGSPPETPAPAALQPAPLVVSAPPPQPAASVSPYLPPAPPPAPVVAAPPAEVPIPRLSDLPESTRRALPQLAIGGSVYSDDPASRMVIINGEVLREGARLGADLVLEQIGPRELLLRFRGQRYRMPV